MAAEKIFEEHLKRWLESEGIYRLGTPKQSMAVPPCGYWEKRWGGGKYTKAGLPDMHIVVCGISIEIELKSATGRPSELQRQKLSQIADAGCIGFVARPADVENIKTLVRLAKNLETAIPHLQEMAGLRRVIYDGK